VCEPFRERWLAACEALPHATVTIEAAGTDPAPQIWSTANANDVALAKRVASLGSRRTSDTQNARALVAAFHRRERAKHTLAVNMGLAAANKRSDALGDQRGAVLDAIAVFPAVSLIDLQAKLTRLIEVEYLDAGGEPEFILADVNRILTREG